MKTAWRPRVNKTFTIGQDSCNFFRTLSLEHTLSGYGAKSHEMANNNQLLPVCVVYNLHTVEKQIGTFSSLNSLGTCVQDIKSCLTPAVESSKIHNGFEKAGFWFQTCQPSLFHTCSDCPDR